MAVDLRSYVFLDSLQLQNASFIATVSKGYYPIGGQACCVIEIAPGIEINRLTDIALKATNVTPGCRSWSARTGSWRCTPTARGTRAWRGRRC